MSNALIYDGSSRRGDALRDLLAGLVQGVSLVHDVAEAERRLATGLYDLLVVVDMPLEQAEQAATAVQDLAPGQPVLYLRDAEESTLPRPEGTFVAVLDEPFSPRLFCNVVEAVLTAPELLRRRLSRRRPVNWLAQIVRARAEGEDTLRARPCRVANLSLGGVMVEVTAVDLDRLGLEDGEEVALVSHSRELPLAASARVAYLDREKDGRAQLGLEFLELPKPDAQRLERYIAGFQLTG